MTEDNTEEYYKTPVTEVITIDKIVTIHYFEFPCNYLFPGEKHDFWELLYVDKGEIEVTADTNGFRLEEGEVIFHKPNEFHTEWANGKIAPNVVVLSFDSPSESMKFFENKVIRLGSSEKNILGEIIKEGKEAFLNSLGPHSKLERRPEASFGSEQLIKIYLELLLINLVRKESLAQNKARLNEIIREKPEGDIIIHIVEYMKNNISRDLSIDEICRIFFLGKTQLKTMFKSGTGIGVITYFKKLKIDEAKKLIREQQLNFTEIADKLGYESIYSFSRSFKGITNMSPSQYAASVKAWANI